MIGCHMCIKSAKFDIAYPSQIRYPSGVSVELGKELTPTQVKDEPTQVEWPMEEGAYYTLCMTGMKMLVHLIYSPNSIPNESMVIRSGCSIKS